MASNEFATRTMSLILLFSVVISSQAHLAPHLDNKRSPIAGPLKRYNIVCFYDLSNYEQGLQPEAVDPHLCTHIITGYAQIINNTIQDTQEHIDAYPKVMQLRVENPDLKIMLMAGSGSNGSTAEMVRTEENRARFINQSMSYLTAHGFDGFDLDWEFPAWEPDPPEDKQLLVQFLKEYREAIDSHVQLTESSPLILSIDVSASLVIIDTSYNVTEIANYVTFVNIMCYDYHFYQWFFPFTGQNSPLFNRSIEHDTFATMNMAWSVNYWHGLGMPKEKINVGMPTYGYTFSLVDPDRHGLDAPASGPGIHGGGSSYTQACQFLADGATTVLDAESKVPYAYRGYDWLSFDNEESVTTKTKWITENGFAGVMVFDLNTDDWKGECDNGTAFPLVRAIRNVTESSQG